MKRVLLFAAAVLSLLLTPRDAGAVPSFSRRYNMPCSVCHTLWGALNGAGVQFRLSGYRAIGGTDLTPASPDIDLGAGAAIPTTLPLSVIAGVGFDYRKENRRASDGTGTSRTGSNLALEDASIFVSSPLGTHLSAFMEFPMYESRAWEFTPTGPAAANDKTTGDLQFPTERPGFEVAKFWWNNLLGKSAPRDSVNLLAGITQLPLAYASGKVRLSVNQYLIYERRALDLISPAGVDGVFSADTADTLFRLSEPQTMFEVNGMLVPGKDVTEVGKPDTLWLEYHAGVANGSNSSGDNNADKDFYGRFVGRWHSQSLGVFGYFSPDTYGTDIRTQGAAAAVLAGAPARNSMSRIGPDMTLSLAPFGIPVWLENQYLFSRESNPTGFGKSFSWEGGFHQLNWRVSTDALAYARYDYVNGGSFNDGHNPATSPGESDEVIGIQYLIQQNVKATAEFRHHEFRDSLSAATLSDNGLTTRMSFGF